jgi:hypothetical protein
MHTSCSKTASSLLCTCSIAYVVARGITAHSSPHLWHFTLCVAVLNCHTFCVASLCNVRCASVNAATNSSRVMRPSPSMPTSTDTWVRSPLLGSSNALTSFMASSCSHVGPDKPSTKRATAAYTRQIPVKRNVEANLAETKLSCALRKCLCVYASIV